RPLPASHPAPLGQEALVACCLCRCGPIGPGPNPHPSWHAPASVPHPIGNPQGLARRAREPPPRSAGSAVATSVVLRLLVLHLLLLLRPDVLDLLLLLDLLPFELPVLPAVDLTLGRTVRLPVLAAVGLAVLLALVLGAGLAPLHLDLV